MSPYVFAILILTVVGLAGASIALFWSMGFNLIWLGLVAVLAAGVVRWAKW